MRHDRIQRRILDVTDLQEETLCDHAGLFRYVRNELNKYMEGLPDDETRKGMMYRDLCDEVLVISKTRRLFRFPKSLLFGAACNICLAWKRYYRVTGQRPTMWRRREKNMNLYYVRVGERTEERVSLSKELPSVVWHSEGGERLPQNMFRGMSVYRDYTGRWVAVVRHLDHADDGCR